jgi:two-component system OmpR family response regulator
MMPDTQQKPPLRILLLEDDAEAADRVAQVFSGDEAVIDHFVTGEDALTAAAATHYDVLVLDRMVPGMDGLTVLGHLRRIDVRTPALILSNLGQTRSRVEGLDGGADDYLAKPFDGEELAARVRSLARRGGETAHPDVILLGMLEVRIKARTVHWKTVHVDLSPKEFDILAYLARNAGDIVSRQMIWNAVWPEYRIPPQINVIDVNLSRLRAKLDGAAGQPMIETVRTQGFVLRAA